MNGQLVKSGPLYMQIADVFENMIENGVITIGDKLPSVRLLSAKQGISISTAFQAYYHLEGKGLIESRPKSGYYVRFNKSHIPELPRFVQQEPITTEVSIEKMTATILKNISNNELINFAIAVPSVDLLPIAKLNKSLLHALHNSSTNCTQYEDIQGNPELRKQVAKMALNWGGRVSANDFVITSGCIEALVICLRAVTQPGDTVAIESPTFFGILQIIQTLQLKVVEIPTDPVVGVDPQRLEDVIIKMNVKACLFITNFNNPLGSCMPDENKKALTELITRLRVPLIEDDIYGELYFGRQRPKTCKTFDKEGWVLLCSSISKSLAPGYRIGWAIPGKFIEEVKRLKAVNTITGTTITQVAVAHFLGMGRYEFHLKNLRKALHIQQLRYLQAIMNYFPVDTKISRPQGGFVFWIELNKKINAFRLYLEVIKNQISIAPGQIFSSQGEFNNYLRISFGSPWNNKVEQGIKTIGDLAKNMLM